MASIQERLADSLAWYISSRPDIAPGDTTNWHTSYWHFIREYATARFGDEWCLTPEQSLSLYSGNRTVPTQIIIRSPKGHNNLTGLPHSPRESHPISFPFATL
jgi:hypothetical protein